MDAYNWRSTAPSGEAPMDTGDWRTQLQPDSRERIVNKIMETLKRHLPFSGQEGLRELNKIAARFEEKIYTAATSQPDYLRKISLKMLAMENKSQNTIPDPLPANPAGNSSKLPDSGASQSKQLQVHNQGQDLSIPLLSNQSQAHQQLLSQHLQNNIATTGVQGSTVLASALPPVFGTTQTTMAGIVGQNNMENMSGMTPNSVGNSMGQTVPSDVFSNAQRQMPGRQPVVPQQQQQQLQNSQYLYQQQLQQQLLEQESSHIQQHQQQQQQQLLLLMAQQNNLPTMHQSQLGSQNTVVLQQPQELLGSHSGNPSLLADEHTIQMLQSKVPMQQQSQQTGTNLLATPGQQSQQQLMSQMQAPPMQLRQQVGLQIQPNPVERDLQERLQVPGQGAGSLLQSQGLIDQHKQLYQSQRPLIETSFTEQMGQINGADWQEEVYQKVKQMKETYLPELSEIYQKTAAKLQQHDSFPPQLKSDQLEKLKIFKNVVERMISVVQMTESSITPAIKEKLPTYEKQILDFLACSRSRKPVSSMQEGVSQPHMQSMQQTQSQVPLVQALESHMNTPLQSMNVPVSATAIPQNSMSSMQHNSPPSLSGVSTSQQNFMSQLQSDSNMDAGGGRPLGSLQQVAVGYLQQNAGSSVQQSGISSLSSQTGVSMLQPFVPIQSNSNMLQQQQHLKHQELILETQQLNEQIQHQMLQYLQQRQLVQQQQWQQQHLHQQSEQQLSSQMQTQEVAQLHQISDANEIKIGQGMDVKPGVFERHLSTGQCASYSHCLLPFVAATLPTPMGPFLMLGDPEKPSLSSVPSKGHQPTTAAQAPAPSLAIGAPGISALPLLAEFTGPGTRVALTTFSGKLSVTEQPFKRLLLRCIMFGILIVGFLLFHEWIANTY